MRLKDVLKPIENRLLMKKDITICNPTRVTLSMGRGIRSISAVTFSTSTSLEIVVNTFASSEP